MEQPIHAPGIGELPDARVLNRATAIAIAVAAVLLVTVVLPAEYGVDPTRVGRILNLTEMGKMKRVAAASAAAAAAQAANLPPLVYKSGQTGHEQVVLAPGEGREVKAAMQSDAELTYEWATNNLPVHYELHGEPRGAGKGVYTSYKIGVSKGEKGKFKAPFEGTQGWYWRNDTPLPVTITVTAAGDWAHFGVVPLKPKA